MKTRLPILAGVTLFSILAIGCDQAPAPQPSTTVGASAQEPQTVLGRAAKSAIDEAHIKLASSNINLNGEFFSGGHHNVVARMGHKDAADPRPDAELTPAGDLLIDGKQVSVSTAQHAMLVQYRQAIIVVAETGMNLGVQGADLGGQAITEVFNGLMSGHPDQIDKNINAKAGKIEAAAMQLCKQLKPVQEIQQQLAATLPEFAPYATLKASDIEDCGKHHQGGAHVTFASDADRAEIRDEIRNSIRSGIGASVQAGAQATGHDADARVSAPAH
jgi:hypothetical protein